MKCIFQHKNTGNFTQRYAETGIGGQLCGQLLKSLFCITDVM